MYVDPILLTSLVVLLVATSALAVIAYVRYRRCEDVYQAYGRTGRSVAGGTPPSPAPDVVEDRYIVGADYGEAPPAVPPVEEPAIPESVVPEVRDIEPVVPEVREPDPAYNEPLEFLPAQPAPADSFFYEYTAEGFVPVDPYEPELPSPSDLSAETHPIETPECDEFSPLFAFEGVPESVHQHQPEPVAAESAAEKEDGFVWL